MRGYYRQMVLIREFELRASEMYTRAKIGGYCHLNVGEEATVVGLMDALEPRDYLFNTYRDHGYALARGLEPGRIMAELFGKTAGVSGGWGGSMHLFDVPTRLMGGYGIVGGQIPPATGAALALTYRGQSGPDAEAVMCVMGDGATNIGAFHESLNLAAVWRLPIVYVIVNNGLGMATTVEAAAGEPEQYKRGCSYRIPGQRVDGNDVLAVRDAARAALQGARIDRQPYLLETMCERLRGHSVVDPARYRSQGETDRVRALDPVATLPASGSPPRGGSLGGGRRGTDRRTGRGGGHRCRRVRRRQPLTGAGPAVRAHLCHRGAQRATPPSGRAGGDNSMTDAAPVGPVITYRKALQDTLRAELVRDQNVFLMGEEIGAFEGSYKITAGLLKDFGPTRVRDTRVRPACGTRPSVRRASSARPSVPQCSGCGRSWRS